VATQEWVGAVLTTVEAWAPSKQDEEAMAAIMAAQKAAEVSLTAVKAGLPPVYEMDRCGWPS
jgi:hypothetical protein